MLPDTLEGYCLTDKDESRTRVYKWKGDADAAGIFKRDASAPVCEREVDAGKVEMCRRCKKRNADAGTYKREADVVIHKCAVIFFFIMVKFSTAQLR
ncbi:uncharacterized protein OCT59_007554 [Rhizophagus irregularis]|uniref:uncharacterized protein n=1 Tax=Rhizophagus irregularis TaxID=588596 RepID=UPI00331B7336|nr:hypothetical protein OCT59_007554 [Rhizophagus irregularis]